MFWTVYACDTWSLNQKETGYKEVFENNILYLTEREREREAQSICDTDVWRNVTGNGSGDHCILILFRFPQFPFFGIRIFSTDWCDRKKVKAVAQHVEAQGERRYSSSFLTSGTRCGGWSASHPGRALPPGKDLGTHCYSLYRRLDRPRARLDTG